MRLSLRVLAVAGAALAALLAVPVSASNSHAPVTQTTRMAASASAAPNAACTVTVTGNGVRIRTAPHLNATVVGEAFAGQHYTDPDCSAVPGDRYTTCGITENFWTKIIVQGVVRYAAAACFQGF